MAFIVRPSQSAVRFGIAVRAADADPGAAGQGIPGRVSPLYVTVRSQCLPPSVGRAPAPVLDSRQTAPGRQT